MCGLVGYYSNNLSYNEDKLKILLTYNEIRGKDSSGLFIKNKSGEYLAKAEGFVTDNLLPCLKFPKEGNLIIAHTRAKTTGLVKKENSHPFQYGTILGAHNGRISNFYELCTKHNFKQIDYNVDSMIIYALMNKLKNEGVEDYVVETIKQLEGPQALLFTDLEFPNRLYFFRKSQKHENDKRPLFKGKIKTEEGEHIYLSSLRNSLKTIGCIEINEVKEDILYYYEDGKLNYKNIVFPEKKITTHVSSSSNFSRNHGQTVLPYNKTIDDILKLREDSINWEHILTIEYDELCVKKVQLTNKNPNSFNSCYKCRGTGKIKLLNKNVDCDVCNGYGFFNALKENKTIHINANNISEEDFVVIISGERKGYVGKFIKADLYDLNKVWVEIKNLEGSHNIPYKSILIFKSQIIKYKTKTGIIVTNLSNIMDKYDISKIVSYGSSTNGVSENDSIVQYSQYSHISDINVGDIVGIQFIFEDPWDLIDYEVLQINNSENILKVRCISENSFGQTDTILFTKDTIFLKTTNANRMSETIEDICQSITTYFPTEKQKETFCYKILDIDDDLQKLIDEDSKDHEIINKNLMLLKRKLYELTLTNFEKDLDKIKDLVNN